MLFGAWLLKMLVKPKPFYQKYDRYLFFWLMLLALIVSCSNFTNPPWYTGEAASQIPCLILFYLLIPQHKFWMRVLPSLSFTVVQVIQYTFFKTPPPLLGFVSVYTGYTLVNIVGIIYSIRHYMNERRNFALHRQKDRLTSLLVADKKKLQLEKELVAHYEAELRKQEVQREKLKTLQAQIKPHFLFNSLNTIAFYCRTNSGLAYKLVNDLATYLQSAYKLQSQTISWEDELKLVRAYLSIEAARMEERLNFSFEETGNLNDCYLPPFTLQPLVENAVRHGLAPLTKGGTLKILACETMDHYYVEVKDNGCGFNPDQKPNTIHNGNEASGGIGLTNIEERLQGLYGCGLTIDSHPGAGTLVSFCIPKQKREILS
jgi:sensor histidine kinase YesM